MKRRRVKITGIGPVTPAGIGREAFWSGILEPVSRVRPYGKLGDEYGPFVAAHLPSFDIGKYVNRALVPKAAARQTLFAVAGAVLAVADAGLEPADLTRLTTAVIAGSSIMDFGGVTSSMEAVSKRGARAAQPRVLFAIGIGSVSSTVGEVLGLRARAMGVSTQCSSGMDAVGTGADLVASGEVDLAICGGTEAPLHRFPLVELRAAELTPPTTEMPERLSRPFDLWRTTGVVSEGACMFVLEPEDSPRAGYSFVAGHAFASDQNGDLCGGMVEAGRLALAEAGIRPEQIESLNAWGPGHKLVDLGEARAMRKLFGPALADLPVVSIKGAVGTPLGAAPAIQIASAALAQRHGVIPPTVNWEYPDPACPLNLSNRPRALASKWTLVNSHGLGAVNSSMVLCRC